jgi:hypothetical protein
VGICFSFNIFQIALQISITIEDTAVFEILKVKAICLKAKPVARYLCGKKFGTYHIVFKILKLNK